jgi:hypothetical protein
MAGHWFEASEWKLLTRERCSMEAHIDRMGMAVMGWTVGGGSQ